ncbi:MAG: hypothetical protein ABJC60_07225 [Actinomycetota bacterium]
MRTRRSRPPPLASATLISLGAGFVRIGGTVRRLTFVPDGGEGRLLATLDDGSTELDARVPRIHARDWAPGSIVVAEGAMQGSEFVVRAYLPRPADDGAGVWIEVAPPFSPVG